MPPSTRHSGRVAAVQLLFDLDVSRRFGDLEASLAYFFEHLAPEVTGEARSFAAALCRGVVSHLESLDQRINDAAKHWRLERMAKVDLAVLRLAAYELCFADEVPSRVVLNEAVELAKELGSGESGSFVNGVLNRIAQDHAGPSG